MYDAAMGVLMPLQEMPFPREQSEDGGMVPRLQPAADVLLHPTSDRWSDSAEIGALPIIAPSHQSWGKLKHALPLSCSADSTSEVDTLHGDVVSYFLHRYAARLS